MSNNEVLKFALDDLYNEREAAVINDDWDQIDVLNDKIQMTIQQIESLKHE